ncbi:MAG: hypothetical protein JXB42_11980 [Deltaproteobacteria bacterium]|nr:hypothetical protein [Deltaproteobacteria bacterium]
MTHTLFRSSPKDFEDFVLFVFAVTGINNVKIKEKMLEVIELAKKYNPVTFGISEIGSTMQCSKEELIGKINEDCRKMHLVFSSENDVYNVIKLLKARKLGLSVSLLAPHQKIKKIVTELEIMPNAFNFDLGVHGNRKVEGTIEQVVSLCGHMRISPRLVQNLIERVRSNQMEPKQAACKVGRVCRCGSFNVNLAAKLLEKG